MIELLRLPERGADATRESPGIGRRVGPETSALVAAGHDDRAIF